jgi:F0F1-type ATP synthase delta subunit
MTTNHILTLLQEHQSKIDPKIIEAFIDAKKQHDNKVDIYSIKDINDRLTSIRSKIYQEHIISIIEQGLLKDLDTTPFLKDHPYYKPHYSLNMDIVSLILKYADISKEVQGKILTHILYDKWFKEFTPRYLELIIYNKHCKIINEVIEALKDKTAIPQHKTLTLALFNKRNVTKEIRELCSELYPELKKEQTIYLEFNPIELPEISNYLKDVGKIEATNIIIDLIKKHIV